MIKRRRQATTLYLLIISEIERRRAQLGWPIWELEQRSGISDGHYGHITTPDSPSGRQATWEVLQDICDSMYPAGLSIRLTDGQSRKLPSTVGTLSRNPAFRGWLRTHLSQIASKGGKASRAARSPEEWSERSRKGANARWARARKPGS